VGIRLVATRNCRLSTQFLPFSSVLDFTKSSPSAYRGLLIKADRLEATQKRTLAS
jgi:hypothetical protein